MFWEAARLLSSAQAPILSLGTTETVNLPRYAPQNRSSPRVLKLVTEKIQINYKTQKYILHESTD